MRASSAAALELHALAKSYRAGVGGCAASARVLDGVDLRVSPGEIVGVAGDEGAGKTTLLLLAAGLLRPDRGRVLWFGRDAGSLDDRAASSVVLVSDDFDRSLGAAASTHPGGVRRGRPTHGGRCVREASSFASSGGARPPRLLLIDEPPLLRAPRGPGTRSGFARLLADFADGGGAVLIASREPGALSSVANRVVTLRGGQFETGDRRARDSCSLVALRPAARAQESRVSVDPPHVAP